MKNKRRKLFTVSGRPIKNPYAPEVIKGKSTDKTGGRVGGGRVSRPKKDYTELEQMRERMRLSNEEITTAMKSNKSNHTNTYNDMANRVDQDVKWGKRDSQFGYVPPPPADTSGKPHTYHEEKVKGKKPVDEQHGQSRVTHKIRVTTGRPTTRSLWNAVKSNGLSRTVLFDTRFRVNADRWDFTEVQKDQTSGFNQRTFTVLPASSYITTADILDVTDASDSASPVSGSQNAYASLLDTTSEIMVHNQNAYHRTKVKVHIVKAMKEADLTAVNTLAQEMALQVLNGDPTVQDPCAVPIVYQFGDYELTASALEPLQKGSQMLTVAMSMKGTGLMESDYFRDHFQIVKSSGITLLAGETLLYRHTHCWGPGYDMANICDTDEANDYRMNEPVSYFYILEHHGADITEGTYRYATDKLVSYMGVNPSYIAVELRKSLRYVNKESSTDEFTVNSVGTRAMHMRVWDSEPMRYAVTSEKEFNLPVSQLTASSSPAVGFMKIVTITDRTANNATHGSNPNA